MLRLSKMRVSALRKLAVLGVGSVLSIAASAAQAQTLRVGMINITPFGAPPPGGGYCADLMGAIAEKTGMQFEFSFLAIPEVLPALTANTIDIACQALSPSNELRAMGIAFTSSTFTNYDVLVVPETDTTPYTTAADFRGQPVGALNGTPYVGMWRNAGVEDVRTPTGAPGTPNLYDMLRSGEIKAGIIAGAAFRYQHDVLGIAAGIRVVETYVPLVRAYPALAVRNTDTELLGVLQGALEALKADGTVATLIDQWGLFAPPF